MMRPNALSAAVVHICVEPVDFRKSINGLSVMVEEVFELNPFEASLFVFGNRTRDKIKVLYWEKNGFCLWYKRLEKDRFKWPKNEDAERLLLSVEQLNWLLDGFDIFTQKPHQSLYFESAI